ncbi:hypothetical protein ND748_22470 [Frankia sp. AiPs1]|uniref:hypothetical protein n=1 Tax=Frankia sp. AiPs1 TaxID=573493 RepID=UPI002042C57B|nr:hypothetical protein [Frankia sp. AiPs1]MCM3924416.1 hypothetical protein [Frankia sp. AiPs1]
MTNARNAPEAPEAPVPPQAHEAARLSTLLLRQLADLVAGLDAQQVGELLAGRTRLTVTVTPGPWAADPAADPADPFPVALRDTAARPAALAPGHPASPTPASPTPTRQTPTRQTPIKQTPARRTPARRTPVRRTPVRQTPVRQTPKATPAVPAASVDVEALRAALLGAASREEAAQHLAALGRVSVPQLRALAGALGVDGVGGKDPKAIVIRKIVDGTVGFRLSSQAMLSDEAEL